MGRPRVLLADDYPEMLERVFQLLQGNFDVIGMAQDGEQAIASAVNLNPEVLVLDISMPFLNGFQVVSRLRDSGCRAKVIFLTVHEDREYVDAAFSVGALGYVLKSRLASDLVPAIQGALQDCKFTSLLQTEVCRTLVE